MGAPGLVARDWCSIRRGGSSGSLRPANPWLSTQGTTPSTSGRRGGPVVEEMARLQRFVPGLVIHLGAAPGKPPSSWPRGSISTAWSGQGRTAPPGATSRCEATGGFIEARGPQSEIAFGMKLAEHSMRRVKVEERIARLDREKEAVVGCRREVRHVEDRVVRPWQAVHGQHADHGRQRRDQHGHLERDRA